MEPLAQVNVIVKDDGVGVCDAAVAVGDADAVDVAKTFWPLVSPAGVLRAEPAVGLSNAPPSAATLASVHTSAMRATAATITPTRARRDSPWNRRQTVPPDRPEPP